MSKLRTRVYSPLRRLGEYELLRKIGSGGMAEVWMGRRAAMAGASKAVAIKLLARDVLDDPAYRQMFIEEARLSMLLTNSNVVQVFDVGEIDGECFMVMEWVDGLNLSELTNKMLRAGETVSIVVAAHVIGEVLRALAYAHGLHHDGAQATIVHRDVSPHNVLVSISGEVKLADFGVARLAREETSGLHVKGKLRYMAPEQLRGRSREPTVDLYAVGAILHELLAGERFRTTRDEGDLYSLVLSGEAPPLSVDIPRELDELRKRLLEPDPKLRIQSADHALELLYAWPGYRNSSLELARLVREWVGVKAPRSGIISTGFAAGSAAKLGSGAAASAPVAASQALTKPTPRPDKPEPGSALSEAATMVEAPNQADSGPQADRGATETRTAMEVTPETSATDRIVPEAPRPPISSLLIVAAVTLAISFGVFGLGFPLGWWGGGGDAIAGRDSGTSIEPATDSRESSTTGDDEKPALPAEVTKQPVANVPAETASAGDTEVTVTAGDEVTAETEDGGSETEDGGETEGGDETSGGDETGIVVPPPPPAKKLKPAEVDFKTGEFGFVYVQVKGKTLTLQPRAIVKLPEGTHRVRLRLDEADPWTNAGPLKLESGKRYEVRMTKPAGFTVKQL